MDEQEIPSFYKPDEQGYCCKCGAHTTMWSVTVEDDGKPDLAWECDTCYNKRFGDAP